jgi:mRNA guanylyltransferase
MVGSVPDIPGIRLTNESDNQLNCFRKEVADLLGRRSNNFPGAQPVSFARHHFQELETREYAVFTLTASSLS